MKKRTLVFSFFALFLIGCVNKTKVANISTPTMGTDTIKVATTTPVEAFAATIAPSPTITPTPQALDEPIYYEAGQIPAGVNALTGLVAENPLLLEEPALLLSIPHFPIAARPQSGLSFAPWVFEFLVGEGTTRFLAVFYGEYPIAEEPLLGDCEIRTESPIHNAKYLGNFVWHDQDKDGIQSSGEKGVAGICIQLYDESGTLIQETSTDSNGHYGFEVEAKKSYKIKFLLPENMSFSPVNIGSENLDSDADPKSGETNLILVDEKNFLIDAGLIASLPQTIGIGQVGPVRSGRLIYIHIQKFFRNSCLIFSGATREIIDQLPSCAQVHNDDNSAGAMLEVERFIRISEKNALTRTNGFNYGSNSFSEIPPLGGTPATQVDFFISTVNQTKWIYDPLSQSWARYIDNINENPVFTRDTDKLTGRELSFENILVLFVEHEILQSHIADMNMEMGLLERGYLFRDGQSYEIKWSTRAGEYEQRTGQRRPIAIQDLEGNSIPLRPGQTWILIATRTSDISEINTAHWKIRVHSPAGFGEY